jgi:hypothetical protein
MKGKERSHHRNVSFPLLLGGRDVATENPHTYRTKATKTVTLHTEYATANNRYRILKKGR